MSSDAKELAQHLTQIVDGGARTQACPSLLLHTLYVKNLHIKGFSGHLRLHRQEESDVDTQLPVNQFI